MEITEEDRIVLNTIFNHNTIRCGKKRCSTDLAVKYHDKGLKHLSTTNNNDRKSLDAAIKNLINSISVCRECENRKILFYPGIMASSYYYLAICFAKKAEFRKAIIMAKESYYLYKELSRVVSEFDEELNETKQLVLSINNAIKESPY